MGGRVLACTRVCRGIRARVKTRRADAYYAWTSRIAPRLGNCMLSRLREQRRKGGQPRAYIYAHSNIIPASCLAVGLILRAGADVLAVQPQYRRLAVVGLDVHALFPHDPKAVRHDGAVPVVVIAHGAEQAMIFSSGSYVYGRQKGATQ